MSKNRLIVKPKEEEAEKPKEEIKKAPKKVNKTTETLKEFAGGERLENILNRRNFPFVLYLAFLGILYISNTYYTSDTIRQIEKTKKQIKELRFEYVTTKKQLIEQSRRNKVMEKLAMEYKNLKESKVPPYKINY